MALVDQFLGKGIVFPIELTPHGLPIISGGLELIKSSILMILSCPQRQRIFLSSFSSRVEELLEEPNDDLMQGLTKFFIMDALKTWEKRIQVTQIDLYRTDVHKLYVEITYVVKTSGLKDVITFPFYKEINT